MLSDIERFLGKDSRNLLEHHSKGIPKELLHLPGPDFVDRVFGGSDRSPQVLRNLQAIFRSGRLAGTGYLSVLPVDQGIEHSAGASFAPNPSYFDPEKIVELAIAGGCNAVATTEGSSPDPTLSPEWRRGMGAPWERERLPPTVAGRVGTDLRTRHRSAGDRKR